MENAFAKHARRANLRSHALRVALLGLGAALALPASASATGGAAAKTAAVEPGSSGSSTTSGTPSSATGTTGGAAPEETSTTPKRALATWFGPGFYGNKTACGQTMSPALVGVASRTLACGTLVQIGYRGHHLTVPVVDRGPYGHIGAMWDLTAGTARALNIKETVRITTAIVGLVPNSPTLGEPAEASPPAASAPAAATASTGGAAAAS
ncbi:MAG TPA: septal ring lytic transglycosylase RlpA family protein [Solirubrobacteraceae bacterium]|jgi:rare lipoprotein A (peptidoglycan hydrolase)